MASSIESVQDTPFIRLGGQAAIRRIVDGFYDLMDNDPAYARLRAMHAADLDPMRESLSGFLTGWCGGPRHWFDANPGKCMMSMHASFTIDSETAEQWAGAMQRAIEDSVTSDAGLATEIGEILARIARNMARG